jgi:hypothetical protein
LIKGILKLYVRRAIKVKLSIAGHKELIVKGTVD